MNKFIKSLLLTALAVSASHVQATTYTNKTTLVPRSHGVNLALENTAGWYDLIHRKADDKFGGNFQAAFFYADSTNKKELGKYFGVDSVNSFTFAIPAGAIGANTGTQFGIGDNNDLNTFAFIHDQANAVGAETKVATATLNPEQKAIGVYFNYHQDFCKILEGLYLRINLPVVNVENNANLNIVGVTPAPAGNANATTLTQFFNGTLPNPAVLAANSQVPLTNALLTNQKSSYTGVADIDIILGYDFLAKEEFHASINLGLSIPTGNKPDGKRVFQAIVGNGQYVGFGAGLDLGACFWGEEGEGGVRVHGALNYRYLFESREKRTLGIKGQQYGQYELLGTVNNPAAAAPLIPAANVTTLNVNVTPGSQVDAIIALGYGMWGLTFDVGYNLLDRKSTRLNSSH